VEDDGRAGAGDRAFTRLVSANRGSGDFADALLAVLVAARRTRGRLRPLFDDITVSQLVLLDAVEQCGADGVSAMAALAGVSQPTVTRGTADLEGLGLVRRMRRADDGRVRSVELTDRGRRMLDAKRKVVQERLQRLWTRLTPAERRLAAPLLRHLAELIADLH